MSALTADAVLRLALAAGFTRAEANEMTVIAKYESGWDPANIGDQTLAKYGSRGLWQVFTGAWSPSDFGFGSGPWTASLVSVLADPAHNAHAAYVVFKAQGLTAWSTYNSYHNDPSWAALLAKVEKIDLTIPAPKGPIVSVVSKADKNYYVKLGNRNPRGAAALAEARKQSESGAAGWHDLCLKFVRTCFGVNAQQPTAYAAWTANLKPRDLTHGWYNPPAGVPVFWQGGSSGAGHIAISDGKGNCWSSDIRRTGKVDLVPITEIHAKWGLKFLGWSEVLNGVRIFD